MSKKIASTLQERDHLIRHATRLHNIHTMDLFAEDPKRFEKLSFEFGGLFVDFSKNHLDDKTLQSLMALAHTANIESWRDKMFSGEIVNITENRPALHTALRNFNTKNIEIDGEDITVSIRQNLDQMSDIVNKIRAFEWPGATGKPITNIVNIGIGGSILGPAAVSKALNKHDRPEINIHYVSNVDAEAIFPILDNLDPEQTLIIAVSKSFTTLETLTNYQTAYGWLNRALPNNTIGRHLIGITATPSKALDSGIPKENILTFGPWVGGRFSLWSTVGIPIALTIGMDGFYKLLQGAKEMDQHFCESPLTNNLPVLMALIGIWNTDFQNIEAHAILPYDERLSGVPQHLQQLEMESTGKTVNIQNESTPWHTAPIVFGMLGNDAQHTFFQALHQGTRTISADFIGCIQQDHLHNNHQDLLMANLFSQTEALLKGNANSNNSFATNEHRICPGNRPSTTILLDALKPETLGQLLALYEHKVFVQGIIWNINPFDQWGVELGKDLAKTILRRIKSGSKVASHDGSTNGLLNRFIQSRQQAKESRE